MKWFDWMGLSAYKCVYGRNSGKGYLIGWEVLDILGTWVIVGMYMCIFFSSPFVFTKMNE